MNVWAENIFPLLDVQVEVKGCEQISLRRSTKEIFVQMKIFEPMQGDTELSGNPPGWLLELIGVPPVARSSRKRGKQGGISHMAPLYGILVPRTRATGWIQRADSDKPLAADVGSRGGSAHRRPPPLPVPHISNSATLHQ